MSSIEPSRPSTVGAPGRSPDQIRSDLVPLPAPQDSMGPPNTPAPQIQLSELLKQLESFQTTLGALQQQAQQWIKLIEQLGSNRYNER